MPLIMVRDDITKMQVDAIVNAGNTTLLGGGGVDGAIHRAAGPQLLEECRTLGGCKTGEAKITKGYNLPAKYVIHTAGPIWDGGNHGEPELLKNCYLNSLVLAKENGCGSIAFPMISCGVYGYPREQAFQIARNTIADFLNENDMTVYMVFFTGESFAIANSLFSDIQEYIDDNYVDIHRDDSRSMLERRRKALADLYDMYEQAAPSQSIGSVPQEASESKKFSKLKKPAKSKKEPKQKKSAPAPEAPQQYEAQAKPCFECGSAPDVSKINFDLDESFSEALLRLIDEKGMTDPQCYKASNIDRKLFNKIKNNPNYKPTKQTAVAFAIGLGLNLEETKVFISRAGYALSHSSKFDIIIEFFIKNGCYNIFDINAALFEYDQVLLGDCIA